MTQQNLHFSVQLLSIRMQEVPFVQKISLFFSLSITYTCNNKKKKINLKLQKVKSQKNKNFDQVFDEGNQDLLLF